MNGRIPAIEHSLTALSVGYLAAEIIHQQQYLSIHSVFSRAVNFSLENGRLLTLLNAEYQNLPSAIRVATPTSWDWRTVCDNTMRLSVRHGQLTGRNWQIDTCQARRWQPTELNLSIDSASKKKINDIHSALEKLLVEYCHQHQIHSELQLLPDWPYSARRPQLDIAQSDDQLRQQVACLIGYGSGLTPDGDDYLLGYLAALSLWHQHPAIAHHTTKVKAAVALRLTYTTDISKHYLTLVLQGDYSEPIHQFLSCICRHAELEEFLSAARQVMQFGASSGVACLAGILHGLRTINSTD